MTLTCAYTLKCCIQSVVICVTAELRGPPGIRGRKTTGSDPLLRSRLRSELKTLHRIFLILDDIFSSRMKVADAPIPMSKIVNGRKTCGPPSASATSFRFSGGWGFPGLSHFTSILSSTPVSRILERW